VKQIRSFWIVFLFCFFALTAYPAWAQEADTPSADNQDVNQLTDEDREIIKNLEMLENIDWLIEADMNLLENLQLFLTNS
jgi:hypothetical protein